jgi:hypothetical protein
MCLDGFKVSLVFGFSSIVTGFSDGGGVDRGVQEVKFLVMDVVVPKA